MDKSGRWMTEPLALVLVSLFLTACGGGGGGNGPGSGDGGGGGGGPPPPPILNYVGPDEQARVTDSNADAFAETTLRGIVELIDISSLALDEPLPAGMIDTVVTGGGGTARLIGSILSDGRGWITAEYNNYAADGLTLTGIEVQRILEPITLNGGRVSIDFHNLQVQSPQRNYLLHGSVTRRDVDRASGRHQLQGDLMVTQAGHAPLRAGPYAISVDPLSGTPPGVSALQVEVGGRSYVATVGYLELSQLEPLHFEGTHVALGATPFSGELRLDGIQDSRLIVSALNRHFGSLVLEEGRMAEFRSRQRRFDMRSDAPPTQLNGALLLAGAGPERFVPVNQLVQLDGRFAVHRDGSFMTHRWRKLSAPPGASLQITAAQEPIAGFVASRFGTYLIEHEVSDGQSSATDTVRIFVGDDSIVPEEFGLRVNVGPDLAVRSGDILHLDGRRTVSPFGQPETMISWVEFFVPFLRPSARHLVFEARESLRPRVSTETPGYYEITHLASTHVPSTQGMALQVIYADYPWRMRRPSYLFSQEGLRLIPEDFLAVDMTGNGEHDLVVVSRGPAIGDFRLKFCSSFGQGHLNGPQVRSYSVPETLATMFRPAIAAGPPNWNGQRDLFVAHGPVIHIFHQETDGSLQQGAPLATAVPGAAPVPQGLHLIDFAAASRPGLVRVTSSEQGGVEVYLWQTDGLPGAPISIEMPHIQQVAVGDLDSDGHADLVVSVQPPGELPALWIGFGDGAGGFSFVQQGSWASAHFAVGDLDSDGRDDIVGVLEEHTLVVLYQQPDGSLQEAQIELIGMPIGVNVDLVDFDGDGRVDIVSHRSASYSALLRQSSSGVFDPAVELPLSRDDGTVGAHRRAWVDFDGDGLMDVVATESRGSREVGGVRRARGLSIVLQTTPEFD